MASSSCTPSHAIMADDLGDQQSPDNGATVENGTSGTATSRSNVVTVCVGGTSYATTHSTLTAAPDSYLAALFGSHWTPSVFVPGTDIPFIDRDPSSFKHVLAYLRFLKHRDSHLVLPESKLELKQLQVEAEFYGLPGLAQACRFGRFGSTLLRHQRSQQQQQPSARHHEPTLTSVRQLPSDGGSSSWTLAGSEANNISSHQSTSIRAAAVDNSTGPGLDKELVAGEDVQLTLLQQQPADAQLLPQCMLAAQELLLSQKQSCMNQQQLQLLSDLVLQHLLHLPLAAEQTDLVLALAQPESGTQLLFQLHYYPVGDLRIDLECSVIPASCAASCGHVAPLTVASAACDLVSPELSPREGSYSRPASAAHAVPIRTPSGSLLPNLAATLMRTASPVQPEESSSSAAAGSVAAAATGTGAMPGPGWGVPVTYHRYSIRETADKFILTTKMPGEAQSVQEAPRTAYRPQLKQYSTLHKLLVQQCPRSSVAGLIWLLETAGFASVKLSTVLETYFVGNNSFPGYKSVLTFEM